MDFKEFASIAHLDSLITITEKIHGTNAQIAVFEYTTTPWDCPNEPRLGIKAGSRNRWITPEDDNYGFAAWVHSNETELIRLLGPGIHYGEWYGQGIGAGYGLKEKRFALFNTYRWPKLDGLLLPQMDVVPVLFTGLFTWTVVEETMASLLKSGSVLSPGYMKPEGVVIYFSRNQTYFKRVFEQKDTAWAKVIRKEKPPMDDAFEARLASYLQPIRLEKLIMRDERYLAGYPKTLPEIASDYLLDLIADEPIEDYFMGPLKSRVFKMIRELYGK